MTPGHHIALLTVNWLNNVTCVIKYVLGDRIHTAYS